MAPAAAELAGFCCDTAGCVRSSSLGFADGLLKPETLRLERAGDDGASPSSPGCGHSVSGFRPRL